MGFSVARDLTQQITLLCCITSKCFEGARKYHEFVAVVLLRVRSTSNNAEGDKRVAVDGLVLKLWNHSV